jgi:hypothetical protein
MGYSGVIGFVLLLLRVITMTRNRCIGINWHSPINLLLVPINLLLVPCLLL